MVAAAVRGVLQGAQGAGAAGRAGTATGSECGDDSGSDASGDELADGISSAASAVQDLSASLVSAAAGDGSEQAHAPRQRGRRRARRRGAGEPAGGVLEQVLAVLLRRWPCSCISPVNAWHHGSTCFRVAGLVLAHAHPQARQHRSHTLQHVLQVLAALTSERWSSLVTLAIGVACRSSMEALAAAQQRSEAAAAAAGRPDLPERLMRFAGAPRRLQVHMCFTNEIVYGV